MLLSDRPPVGLSDADLGRVACDVCEGAIWVGCWVFTRDPLAALPADTGKNGALMIARARMALPGMIMSLVLSVPVLIGQAMAATDPAPQSTTQRMVSPRKTVKAPVTKSSSRPTSVKAASVRTAEQRPQTRSTGRVRVQHSNGGSNDRMIYRTSNHGDALIDDGTLWREAGNSATWQQTGVASWYGGAHWQGHRTTSGARYDQNELTAAHATLPIGTRVRVTLNDNSARFVVVTINDRPGTRTRIIDLSRQAAAELGIIQRGTAMVTLTPL